MFLKIFHCPPTAEKPFSVISNKLVTDNISEAFGLPSRMTDEVSVSLGEQPFSATEVTRAVTTDPRVPHWGDRMLGFVGDPLTHC